MELNGTPRAHHPLPATRTCCPSLCSYYLLLCTAQAGLAAPWELRGLGELIYYQPT